jgi:phosphatidate phosphatase
MDWDGSKLLKHTLQFLAIAAAVFVAMTRISDYKHHWSDVLSGLIIGTIVACVTVSPNTLRPLNVFLILI